MNEFFSINRYYKLLKKELTEKSSVIIKIAGILSLLLFGYWLSILLFNMQPSGVSLRNNYLFFATFVSMVIAPFNLYKSYNHPKRGMDYVMLPASVSEKFLSMTSITVIILPIIVFTSILLTDTILSAITPSVFTGNLISDLWNNENLPGKIINYLIIQQGCIFGNFLFTKNKIFKTLFSGAGIFIVFGFIMLFFLVFVFKGELVSLAPSTHINLNLGGGGFTEPMKIFFKYFNNVLYFVLPVAFITGTFYKMKTQQY